MKEIFLNRKNFPFATFKQAFMRVDTSKINLLSNACKQRFPRNILLQFTTLMPKKLNFRDSGRLLCSKNPGQCKKIFRRQPSQSVASMPQTKQLATTQRVIARLLLLHDRPNHCKADEGKTNSIAIIRRQATRKESSTVFWQMVASSRR